MDDRVTIFFMTLDNNFIKKFGDNFRKNINLSNYSWFNLGGNAEYFFKAKDKSQLLEFLEGAKKKNLNTTILGAGSNTLFRDKGVKGAVIKLGQTFSYTKIIDDNILDAGAATLDRKVANFAKDNSLGGLEFLSCIPGSVGGAIVMNSGCYKNDISKVLLSIRAIDKNNLIIISAKFKGLIGDRQMIEKKQSELIEKKKNSQPSQIKTCGSTFKNLSEDKKAWMLIKEAGCDQLTEGDAMISQKHCNFFVNNGNAKSSDIENLIKKVKKKVYEKTGVNLELEIKIVGE